MIISFADFVIATAVEKKLGFLNDSIISTSTLFPTAKTVQSTAVGTYTILTAEDSAVVFANQGTTKTVSLNPSSTVAPS